MRPPWPVWGYVLYGARLLKLASVAAMTTPPASLSRKAVDYGLATQVFGSITSNPSVGHTGSTIGYSSFLLVDPTTPVHRGPRPTDTQYRTKSYKTSWAHWPSPCRARQHER